MLRVHRCRRSHSRPDHWGRCCAARRCTRLLCSQSHRFLFGLFYICLPQGKLVTLQINRKEGSQESHPTKQEEFTLICEIQSFSHLCILRCKGTLVDLHLSCCQCQVYLFWRKKKQFYTNYLLLDAEFQLCRQGKLTHSKRWRHKDLVCRGPLE